MDTRNQTHVDLEDGHGVGLSYGVSHKEGQDSLEGGGLVDDDHEEGLGSEKVDDNNSSVVAGKGRDCRICHLSLDDDDGELIISELGCSCKGDLAAAHNHCAQTWFNIRGNMVCEICGSLARNVINGGHEIELGQCCEINSTTISAPEVSRPIIMMSLYQQTTEPIHIWKGYRYLNFVLAGIIFVFVLSWIFHINLES